ncbi:MAG: hypothetical protein ACT4QC_14070 [Planctomycetaceae bacterium]
MASIARDKNGNRRILFVAPGGKRPTIRLGKVSHRTAEGIKYRVEQLVEHLTYKRAMDTDLAQWVADLEPRLAERLARVGLIAKPDAKPAETLRAFLTPKRRKKRRSKRTFRVVSTRNRIAKRMKKPRNCRGPQQPARIDNPGGWRRGELNPRPVMPP